MKQFLILYPTLILALIAGTAESYGSSRPILTNEYGMIIRNADGEKIEFSRQELESRQGCSPELMHAERCVRPADRSCPAPGGPALQASWKYFAFGTGIGVSNINTAKVGGKAEIIIGCGSAGFGFNKYWMILQHNPVSGEYDQVFVSPVVESGNSIRRMITGKFTPDLQPDLLVAMENGEIQIWDLTSRSLLHTFATAANQLNGLDVADVDLDGDLDLLVVSDDHLRVYDIDGVLQWELPGVGGADVITAQMDGDAALEIATTDGNVTDGLDRTVQWNWPDAFGFTLEAADIDDDGMDELVAAEGWDYIWAFDVDTELPKWSINIFNTGAISLADIDRDGTIELLVGEAQWGGQLAYDTRTQMLEWWVNNPEHGTTDVHCGDVDRDGVVEIIWGSGHTSSGSDHLFIADWTTDTIEWSNPHLDGPFRGPVQGDLDGDGTNEIVTITDESDSGYSAGRILVFQAPDMTLRAISPSVAEGSGWSGTHELRLREVDGTAGLELVVATSGTYDGLIEIYDYDGSKTFTRTWQLPYSSRPDGAFRCVDVADLDNDGELEVIGGADESVFVYDITTGNEEWHSLFVAYHISGLEIAQVDGDDSPEIIALGSDGDIYVFDGLSKALEAIITAGGSSIRIFSRPGLPDRILAGDEDGAITLYRFNGSAYIASMSVNVTDGPVDGLAIGPWSILWAGSGGVLRAYSAYGSSLLWTSETFGSVFGTHVEIVNPGAQMAVAAGSYGLVGFTR